MDTKTDLNNFTPQPTIALSNEERDFFLALLEEDEPPSPKSLVAAKRYNDELHEGSEYQWHFSDDKS